MQLRAVFGHQQQPVHGALEDLLLAIRAIETFTAFYPGLEMKTF